MAESTPISELSGFATKDCVPTPSRSTAGPHFEYEERLGWNEKKVIAGVDEAGRGCLAGPVVAAAVVLPVGFKIDGLRDSKVLSTRRREALFEKLLGRPDISWGIGVCTEEEIFSMNILRASQEAMRRAVRALPKLPDHALVDGLSFAPFPTPMTSVIRGDSICCSIAAASILAKVTRDRLMIELDTTYPGYGFARNKGYGTSAHLSALKNLGPCPAHRVAFTPVRRMEQFTPDFWL